MEAATERRAAEPQSVASRQELLRLRLAVEASGEVVFMTDARGTITYVNPEFVRLYGYTPAEVVGRTTPRILKGGIATPDEYGAFWRQLVSKHVVRREFLNRTKAGVLVHVESSANPIFHDNQLVGFLAVQRDITARKATEAALVKSEAWCRTLAEAAQDSIFIVTRDGRIEYANTASTQAFGLRPEDAIGKRLNEVFPGSAADEMWRQACAVFATGQRQYFESRFVLPERELWLETWLVPVGGSSTEPATAMGVARDISARKRLEREFMQAQKMEAVGQLAGGIAHDFNNLLTAILGYSELVRDRVHLDAELSADIDEIRKAGERASRLTRQLLAFSRRQALAPQVLDLNEVVSELHKMLSRVIGEDIRLEIRAERNLDRVKADPGQIEQVVMNLAVNARDAMPKGGDLRIETANAVLDADFVRTHAGAVAGRYVSLKVIDSGCGMPSGVLAHVFEPFFTTKPVGKGTGLGLATVYGIVKQSGGYIAVDSAPDTGTTMTIYLPTTGAAVAPRVATPASAASLCGHETVLVAEDQPGVRQLLRRILEQYGYTVLMAENVAEVMTIADRHQGPIDLFLSDVIMPDMNGPDLAQRIVRRRPAIKVLYVSGFTSLPAGAAAVMSQKAAFLSKPFTPRALAAKIREVLRGDTRDAPSN